MPTKREPDTPNDEKAVIERLNALRDRHRLALHSWETGTAFEISDPSWDALGEVPAADIPDALRAGTMPLLSVSQVPSRKSGITILPWGTEYDSVGNCAYLLDMSADQAQPPLVIKACTDSLASKSDVHAKEYNLHSSQDIPPLAAIYEPFSSKEEWIHALAGEDGRRLSEEQMDALGKFYETGEPSELIKLRILENSTVCFLNELLLATSKEHVRAICMPVGVAESLDWYAPLTRLGAALGGLQNIARGLDVPVVMYQVSPPLDTKSPAQGAFTWLGKGKKKLTCAALDALSELQAQGITDMKGYEKIAGDGGKQHEYLFTAVWIHLGHIDISFPLSEQHAAMVRLEEELRSPTQLR